jgi:long-chain acyl-CoA synthetase
MSWPARPLSRSGIGMSMFETHIVLRPGHVLNGPDLIAFAKERIADYKTPEAIIFRSELPKGAIGKVQRRALREMEQARAQEA